MIPVGSSYQFEVTTFPQWKHRIVMGVMRVLNMRGVHYMLFVTEKKIEPAPCRECNNTGRLMTVDTYELIDCPVCDGRG